MQGVRSAALQLVQHLVLCSGPLMQLGLRMLVLGLSPPPRSPQPGGGPASPGGGGAAWKPQPHAILVQDQVIGVLLKVRAAAHTGRPALGDQLLDVTYLLLGRATQAGAYSVWGCVRCSFLRRC
jgi:hypothetical protein